MGGQGDTPGKESYGLHQTIPEGNAGCHLSTDRKFLSKKYEYRFPEDHSTHNSPTYTIVVYH